MEGNWLETLDALTVDPKGAPHAINLRDSKQWKGRRAAALEEALLCL